jgi:hypothetical protein
MLFSFDKLLIKCLPHEGLINNQLSEKKSRSFFPSLMKSLAENSPRTLREVEKTDRHFHLLSEKEKLILEKVLQRHYPFRQLKNHFNNLEICQMSSDEKEGRMIGIIQQINKSVNHPERNYLFSPLIFDFEHTFHPNLRKKKLKKDKLICIMSAKDCNQ